MKRKGGERHDGKGGGEDEQGADFFASCRHVSSRARKAENMAANEGSNARAARAEREFHGERK